MSKRRVLVVEDDRELQQAISDSLVAAGYVVAVAQDAEHAAMVQQRFQADLVLSDLQMEPTDGWALLESFQRDFPTLPVILMTAHGSIEHAVKAMQHGAADFIAKPFSAPELIELLAGHRRPVTTSATDQPVAADPASRRVLSLAERLAGNDLTVMIQGESGTGKEVYARYIHAASARRDAPFVAINCAAIPESMLESILFGYERGAFTGANSSHSGKFEQAQHGTLLLDEISEMEIGLQAKLLRVIQEKEVERLGSTRSIKLDVRILATTNRDLKQEVVNGQFREDLFYRLNVLPLQLPPLRDRPADILPLAQELLVKHAPGADLSFSEAAIVKLQTHTWSGNVRELENVVARCSVLAESKNIEPIDLMFELTPEQLSIDPLRVDGTQSLLAPSHGPTTPAMDAMPATDTQSSTTQSTGVGEVEPRDVDSADQSLDVILRAFEQRTIFHALEQHHGNKQAVAHRLGISPRTLRHKLAQIRATGTPIPGEYSEVVA